MYSFERLAPTNLNHLITLYKNAFNLDVSLEYLTKKYSTVHFGAEYIGYLAFAEDGTPAAYYGVFPIVSVYSGKKILCAQSGDTMTHQDHRGKGLFVDLAKKTFQLAGDMGVKFIFGFPNQNSYPGFVKKLYWKHEEDLNLYIINVKTIPLVKIIKKIPFLNVFYKPFLSLILLFYKKTNFGFDNSFIGNQDGYILHDKDFFVYKKYFQSFFLMLSGKATWLKIDGRLWIGDIESSDEVEFNKVIKSLKTLAFFIGANEIHFHAHVKTKYDDYMSKVGVLKSQYPIGFLDINSGLDLSKIKYLPGDFDTF